MNTVLKWLFVTSRCLLSASPALVPSPASSGPRPPSSPSLSSCHALSPPAEFYHPKAPCTLTLGKQHAPRPVCEDQVTQT